MLKKITPLLFLYIMGTIGLSQENDDWEKMIDLGVAAYQEGNYDRAIELTKKASEVIAIELGKADPAYSTVLNNLGAIYKKKGQLNAAEQMYKDALKIIEDAKSNEKLTFSEKDALEQAHQLSINDLAKLYQQMGRYNEANLLLQSIGLAGDDNISTDDSELGQLYRELNVVEKEGNYDAALEKAETIVKLQKEELGTSHPNYAKAITRLGIVYQKTGQYNEAEPLFNKALNIYNQKFGNTHPDYGTSLNNLATLYSKMGRYNEAEQAYKQTIAINEKIYGTEHIEYANSLNNLANLYYQTGEKETALAYAQEALKVIKRAVGEESEAYVNSLSTLAGIYLSVGQLNTAEQMMIESLTINEKQFGKNNINYAATLNNIGNLYLNANAYSKAEQKFKESLDLYKELLGEKHLDYIKPLFQLARSYFTQKEDEKAEPLYLEGISKIHDLIRNYFPGLSDQEKAAFYRKMQNYFDEFNSFAIYRYETNPKIAADVYNNQLKTKAILLNASTKIRKHIFSSGDEELIKLYKSLQGQRDELVKAYNMDVDQQLSQGIDIEKLEKDINNKEKKLSQKSQEFAQEFAQSERTWLTIRDNLKSREAAIEVIRFTDITDNSIKYSFLTVKNNTRGKPDLLFIDGKNLEKRYIKYYRNSIKYGNKDLLSYQYFWKFIDSKLTASGIRKAYVSPDGVYNQINLNTLYDKLSNKYVLERGIDLHMLSNTKDFLNFEETQYSKKALSKKVMIVGNPDFNYGHTDSKKYQVSHTEGFDGSLRNKLLRSFSNGHIAPLPGTAEEVVNISSTLKKNKIKSYSYTQGEASEETLKSFVNPKVLHIATHGFFMENVGNSEAVDPWLSNPLLRSGILLSGSESAITEHSESSNEDGILTSFEAMNLELNKTDLVVLSACETGLGEVKNGEGVYGLQRSLQVAGAKSILMSLWTVNDQATQELMTSFYNYLFKFQDKRGAFKQAQKDLLTKYGDPNLWGAFVMVGQ